MKQYKYVRNADPTLATAVIKGLQGGDLILGGQGELTDEEVTLLESRGVVLEQVDDGLNSMHVDELRDEAEKLGVDHKGLKKSELIEAVRDARSQTIDVAAASEELPATATVSGQASGGTTGAGTGQAAPGAPAGGGTAS